MKKLFSGILILIFTNTVYAMSMFKAEVQDVFLFSPLEGKILLEGKPVADAKITLNLTWNDGENKESLTYTTDSNGDFSLPEKTASMKLSPLAQFAVSQSIFVSHEGKEYKIWVAGKGDSGLYGELGGKAIGVTCELTDAFARVKVKKGMLGTSCKWQSIITE